MYCEGIVSQEVNKNIFFPSDFVMVMGFIRVFLFLTTLDRMWDLSPSPAPKGLDLCLLWWNQEVLTTGPLWKSLSVFFFFLMCNFVCFLLLS